MADDRDGGDEVWVRPARVDDGDSFRSALESVAAEGRWIGTEAPVDWSGRRPWDQTVADPDVGAFVAEAPGGAVVGWCIAELDRHGRTQLSMGLVEGWRGRGVGRRLLHEAVGWSRSVGAHKVLLELWAHNDPARRLYESAGFVVEGRHRRHWRRRDGSLWDSLSMGLVLDEHSPPSPRT